MVLSCQGRIIGVSLFIHMIFLGCFTLSIAPSKPEITKRLSIHGIFKERPHLSENIEVLKANPKIAVKKTSKIHSKEQKAFQHAPANEVKAVSPKADLARIKRSGAELLNGESVYVAYPSRARLLKIEGSVRLKVTVLENGSVLKAEVLSGPAFGLRQAAIALAKKLLFLPATDDYGHALVSEVEHEVIFRLRRD